MHFMYSFVRHSIKYLLCHLQLSFGETEDKTYYCLPVWHFAANSPGTWIFWYQLCALLTTQRALIGTHTFSWGMSLTINLIGCFVCFVWGASEEGLALRLIGFLAYTPLSSFLYTFSSHPVSFLECLSSFFSPYFLFAHIFFTLHRTLPSLKVNWRSNTQHTSLVSLCSTFQVYH